MADQHSSLEGRWREAEGWEAGAVGGVGTDASASSSVAQPWKASSPVGHHPGVVGDSPAAADANVIPRPPRSSSLTPTSSPERSRSSPRPRPGGGSRLTYNRGSGSGSGGGSGFMNGNMDPRENRLSRLAKDNPYRDSTGSHDGLAYLSPSDSYQELSPSPSSSSHSSFYELAQQSTADLHGDALPSSSTRMPSTTLNHARMSGTSQQQQSWPTTRSGGIPGTVTRSRPSSNTPPVPPSTPPNQTSSSNVKGAVMPAGSSLADGDNSEEALAIHVRSVYARLEEVGVQDDGYAPGIERTRERRGRGPSSPLFVRGSLLMASASGEDGAFDDLVLDRREEEVLRKTDRYGFFEASHPLTHASGSMPRVTNLVAEAFTTLPSGRVSVHHKHKSSSPNPRKSKASKLITTISDDPDYFVPAPKSTSSELALASVDAPEAAEKELERVEKWSHMVSHSNTTSLPSNASGSSRLSSSSSLHNSTFALAKEFCSGGSKRNQFRRRCYKGIPDRWRRVAWEVMMRDKANKIGNTVLSQQDVGALIDQYRRLKQAPSDHDVQIDLDVPRTISGHVLFHTRYGKGQRNLFYLLHAFSQHCADCAYCQGMGPIGATFLSYYEAEAAYIAMIRLHDVYGMHDIFKPGFPGLQRCFYVQERLVESLMPDVHAVLLSQGVSPSAYATKWYITLFANTVTFSSQLRLWDAFLLDGLDVFIITSVSILWAFRTRLASPAASFECILTLLSCYFIVEDETIWMNWIRKILARKDIRHAMAAWRIEWDESVMAGTKN